MWLARKLVDAAVSRHVEAWAKTIKLTPSDARFAQFLKDVTETLYTSIDVHNAEQLFPKFNRVADAGT
jgi:hypothetical protein